MKCKNYLNKKKFSLKTLNSERKIVTFSFGMRLIVLSGLSTRNTRNDLIVFKFLPAEPSAPLKNKFILKNCKNFF